MTDLSLPQDSGTRDNLQHINFMLDLVMRQIANIASIAGSQHGSESGDITQGRYARMIVQYMSVALKLLQAREHALLEQNFFVQEHQWDYLLYPDSSIDTTDQA